MPTFNLKTPHQNGQVAFFLILVIVIIFAVMLAGGGGSLLSGDMPSSVTEAPTPTSDITATPSPTPNPLWDIIIVMDSECKQGKSPYKTGTATVKGTQNGYVRLEINDSGFKELATQEFTKPLATYKPLTLTNDDGFNSRDWKLTVYSGGQKVNGKWVGGEFQATKAGSPTNCT